jgi:Ni,Fe-hydrogenase III large subunit
MLTDKVRIDIVEYIRKIVIKNENINNEIDVIILIMKAIENATIAMCAMYLRESTKNTPHSFVGGMLANELEKQYVKELYESN